MRRSTTAPAVPLDTLRAERLREIFAALDRAGLPRDTFRIADGEALEVEISAGLLVDLLSIVAAARELRVPPASHEKIAALDKEIGDLVIRFCRNVEQEPSVFDAAPTNEAQP